MERIIKCPKCATEMVEGFIADYVDQMVKMRPVWVFGKPEESFWSGIKTSGKEAYYVATYRCPRCNYLEFYLAS